MQSVRKELIDILNCAAESKVFPSTTDDMKLKQIALISGLIDDKYLCGEYIKDASGIPCVVNVTGITIKGREYVDKLEADAFSKSSKGKLTAILAKIGWIAVGVGGTILTQWFSKILGLN